MIPMSCGRACVLAVLQILLHSSEHHHSHKAKLLLHNHRNEVSSFFFFYRFTAADLQLNDPNTVYKLKKKIFSTVLEPVTKHQFYWSLSEWVRVLVHWKIEQKEVTLMTGDVPGDSSDSSMMILAEHTDATLWHRRHRPTSGLTLLFSKLLDRPHSVITITLTTYTHDAVHFVGKYVWINVNLK